MWHLLEVSLSNVSGVVTLCHLFGHRFCNYDSGICYATIVLPKVNVEGDRTWQEDITDRHISVWDSSYTDNYWS